MEHWFRASAGLCAVLFGLGVLFYGVTQLRQRDYLACIVLSLTGLAVLRAGVELLRPSVGE